MRGDLSPVFKLQNCLLQDVENAHELKRKLDKTMKKIPIKDLLDTMSTLLTSVVICSKIARHGEYCCPLVSFSLGSCYRHYLRENGPLVKVRRIFGTIGGMPEALDVFQTEGLISSLLMLKSTSVFRRVAKIAAQLTPIPKTQQNSVAS